MCVCVCVCVNKLPTVISEKQAEVKRGSWFSPCQRQDSSSSSCPPQPLQPRPSWCLFSWGHSWRLPSSSVVVDKASSSNPRFPLENLSRYPMMIHMWKMSKPVKLNLKLVNYEWNGYRMTINCSSHGQVQLLLVHAPSIPPDQHPGMLYQLRFMIQQSHWEPLGRCWNHFCSDWQMRIGCAIKQHAALWCLLRGIWNACCYYYYASDATLLHAMYTRSSNWKLGQQTSWMQIHTVSSHSPLLWRWHLFITFCDC